MTQAMGDESPAMRWSETCEPYASAALELGVAAFDWPHARFPARRYPLHSHAEANAAEEAACLAEVCAADAALLIVAAAAFLVRPCPSASPARQVESLLASQKRKGRDVAAVVVEPVQAEGGDNHALAAFFLGLRRLCTAHGAPSQTRTRARPGCAASAAARSSTAVARGRRRVLHRGRGADGRRRERQVLGARALAAAGGRGARLRHLLEEAAGRRLLPQARRAVRPTRPEHRAATHRRIM